MCGGAGRSAFSTSWILLDDTVPERETEGHSQVSREPGETAWSQASQLNGGHVLIGGTEAAEVSKGQIRAEDRMDRVL